MEIGSPAHWAIFEVVHATALIAVFPLVKLIRIAWSRHHLGVLARRPYGAVVFRQLVILAALAWPIVRFGWSETIQASDALGGSWPGLLTVAVLTMAALSPMATFTACEKIRADRELLELRREYLTRIVAALATDDRSRVDAVMSEWYVRFDEPPSLGELLDQSRSQSERGAEPVSVDVATLGRLNLADWAVGEWEVLDRARRQASDASRIYGRVAVVVGPLERYTDHVLGRRGVSALVHIEGQGLALRWTGKQVPPIDHREVRAVIETAGEGVGHEPGEWWVDEHRMRLAWTPGPDGVFSEVKPEDLGAGAARALRPAFVNWILRLGRS